MTFRASCPVHLPDDEPGLRRPRNNVNQVRTPIILLLGVSAALAQRLIPPSRIPENLRPFAPTPGDEPLECEVSQLRPTLNLNFQFQAGYAVRIPMRQYRGPAHGWAILVRVTPEGGSPVYLGSRILLPNVPETKVEMEVGGGYLLGEGRYKVAWELYDDKGRVCRKQWGIEAKREFRDRKVKMAIPGNTVSAFSRLSSEQSGHNTDGAPSFRLTILMHAAPIEPQRNMLRARDSVMLLGMLSSLLDRLPVRQVRLVAFNLEQQKEMFRQDNFEADAIEEVAQAISNLQLSVVDYHVLQNHKKHVELLADLVNRELAAPSSPDVVLFLGPLAKQVDRFPEQLLERPVGEVPHFFYLQYRPFLRLQPALPDMIQSVVARLKGETVVVTGPADFEKGIEEIEQAEARSLRR